MKRLREGKLTPDEARKLVAKTLILHSREIFGLAVAVAVVGILSCIAIYSNAGRSDQAASTSKAAQDDVKKVVPAAKKAATTEAKKQSVRTRTIIQRQTRTQVRTIVRREIGSPGARGRTGLAGAIGASCDPDTDPKCQGPPGPPGLPGEPGRDGVDGKEGPAGPRGDPGVNGIPCDPAMNPMCQGPTGPPGMNGVDGQPGPPPQPAMIQFTDGTGAVHTCLIDFTVGPSVVQTCT